MDYQKMVEYRNTHNPFAARLGIVVTEIGAGCATVVKTIGEDDINPVGRAHGGCFFAMADTACGSAAASYGKKAVTVSANYNFFRGGSVGDEITAKAREVKHGGTLCVYEALLTNQRGETVGQGTLTFYTLDEAIAL
jgi:phenylacetic acid degradation protein PaaD